MTLFPKQASQPLLIQEGERYSIISESLLHIIHGNEISMEEAHMALTLSAKASSFR